MENIWVRKGDGVKKPPHERRVFNDPRIKWMWVIPHEWPGAQWAQVAQQKLVDPQWMQTGEAFKELWLNAMQTPGGGQLSSLSFTL